MKEISMPPSNQTFHTIITHDHCVDGFVSELLLLDAYPNAKAMRVTYENRDAIVPEPGMIFCDMSPSRERAAAFFAQGAVVLDHHRTAAEIFQVPGAQGAYIAIPGVSGAVLALQHWHANYNGPWADKDSTETIAEIAELVGIYDTWVETHPRFLAAGQAHAVLDLLRTDSAHTLRTLADNWGTLSSVGKMLFGRHTEQAKEIASRAVMTTLPRAGQSDLRVACIVDHAETPVLNLAASKIDADLIVYASFAREILPASSEGIVEAPNGSLRCSIRSRGNFDCASLAKALGGGGHWGAAGFGVPRQGLIRPVQLAVDAIADALAKNSAGTP
jgi:hypothetical protein